MSAWSNLKYAFKMCAVGVGTILFTNAYITSFARLTGPSMEPTLYTDDVVLMNRIAARFGQIDKGDIVVAKKPLVFTRVCKRVVALPGDIVQFNGVSYKVPMDHFWLEGDNNINSTDSRDYGPVHTSLIVGRCYCRIWPDIEYSLFENNSSTTETENDKRKKLSTSKSSFQF